MLHRLSLSGSEEEGVESVPSRMSRTLRSGLGWRVPSIVWAMWVLPVSWAWGQASWESHKGRCDDVFRAWRTQSLDQLRDCTMSWEMYRDVIRVDEDERQIVHEALDKLYQRGSNRDAVMALSAMKRLGVRPTRLRPKTRAVPKERPEQVEVVRETWSEPAPSEEEMGAVPVERPPDRQTAKMHTQRGRSFFVNGKSAEALSEFLIAADYDPTYADPLYGVALCFAHMNKSAQAIQFLHKMKSINSERARQLLHRAPQDPIFARVRRADSFKDLTGTAEIQILNGAGEAGRKTVLGYKERLEELGMPVGSVANDRSLRENTYVYAKPGFKEQGETIRRQLRLGLVHTREITWQSPYDIILVHGVPKNRKWNDDEAEKSGKKEAAKKKKAEEAAKKKKKEKERKEKEAMEKKLKMLKMMEDMEAKDAAGEVPGAPDVPEAPEAPSMP